MKTSVLKKKIQLKKPCELQKKKSKKKKLWQNLTSILATGVIISSCSSNPVDVHIELQVAEQCIFEKFTEEEKKSMIEAVGRKIHKNQESCRLRNKRINAIIQAHNKAHGDK